MTCEDLDQERLEFGRKVSLVLHEPALLIAVIDDTLEEYLVSGVGWLRFS
jgi:hypothetical protein